MNRSAIVFFAALLAACTPGGQAASGNGASAPASITIDVNLTNHAPGQTAAGLGAGYAPLTTMVAVGSTIRFTNSDGFAHTATAVAGSTFPGGFPFTSAALMQSGTLLSAGFSSGDLQAGATSQALTADKAGMYLFGCFHHYGAPMRGLIVVQ
jgi:plastocyanin